MESAEVNKPARIDNISGRFLKDCTDMLANQINQICNLYIKLSHFPNSWKLALLYPLHTKNVLKQILKIFGQPPPVVEKIIQDWTMECLADNKMLYRYQSGFCKIHSKDTCLLYFEDEIVIDLDSDSLFEMIVIAGLAKWISKWWGHGRLENIVRHSTVIVGWQEKFLSSRHSRMGKIVTFWPC